MHSVNVPFHFKHCIWDDCSVSVLVNAVVVTLESWKKTNRLNVLKFQYPVVHILVHPVQDIVFLTVHCIHNLLNFNLDYLIAEKPAPFQWSFYSRGPSF